MLDSIYVKDLALIKECTIDFGKGLNILTGETGAGKSMLFMSVNLALGARADKDVIRNGAEEAFVSLSFSADKEAGRLLDSWDIPYDDSIVISRKITSTKNVFKINGEISNARQVKELAGFLLDIHGQHEHQSLLNNARQLEMLDAFGGDGIRKALSAVKAACDEYSEASEELAGLKELEKERDREMGLLSYETEEIDNAALTEGEDEELETKYRRMSSCEKLIEQVNEALSLTGGEGSGSAGSLISRAIQCINKAKSMDESLEEIASNLSEAEEYLGDFVIKATEYLNDLDYSPEEFAETEERLDLINGLKAKFGNSVSEILRYREEAGAKLDKLKNLDEYKNKLEAKVKDLKAAYDKAAGELTALREKAASKFEKELTKELLELSFATVSFKAMLTSDKARVSAGGWDSVEFMISVNPGEPVKPMKNVSSGGELSRIMLGVKTILADADGIDSLIFDEIDAGISGRTAWAVSGKLNRLSRKHQIIAITHLAQIAAMADRHFEIEKSVKDSKTVTDIRLLDKEGEIKELARLLGADTPGEATLTNARELKEKADARKED